MNFFKKNRIVTLSLFALFFLITIGITAVIKNTENSFSKISTMHFGLDKPQVLNDDQTQIETLTSSARYPTNNQENSNSTQLQKLKDPFLSNNKIIKEALQTDEFHGIYFRTEELFGQQSYSQNLASWVALGLFFDSSEEYGKVLNYNLKVLDENSNEVMDHINNNISKLTPSDSFIRGQLLNLVNNLPSLSKDVKIDFFGTQASRSIILNDKDLFTDDSLNITTAIILLKQNQVSDNQLQKIYRDSLDNNSDPQLRNKIVMRFENYFPQLVDKDRR